MYKITNCLFTDNLLKTKFPLALPLWRDVSICYDVLLRINEIVQKTVDQAQAARLLVASDRHFTTPQQRVK
jgi:hypothetical protein